MQFRLVKTGKSYSEADEGASMVEPNVVPSRKETGVPPVIWETGNVSQIGSLLVLREAELLLAESQLTGDRYIDWHIRNQIRDLEIKIANLKRWLQEALENDKDIGA